MNRQFVSFDHVLNLAVDFFQDASELPEDIESVLLLRDLFGVVHIAVPEVVEDNPTAQQALLELAENFLPTLGLHGSAADAAILFLDEETIAEFRVGALEITSGVYLVDRLVTGKEWWTIREPSPENSTVRYTLFSVKGGVGRTTTAAVLARHLASKGERVLVLDLDLESPGLLSAMLEPVARPQYGVTDWFVEDLIGQGDQIVDSITGVPRWSLSLEGDVRVVPAYGSDPGEYLAKLGRVYLDVDQTWAHRLERMLEQLEARFSPTVMVIESRSGLHDIAASAVTELGAHVFLFATDWESTWIDYSILFRHWQQHGLATSIRENLSVVSALTPFLETDRYLNNLTAHAWDLFRDCLYDELGSDDYIEDLFSFDINDQDAPHYPLMIGWSTELAAGTSLTSGEVPGISAAYSDFLRVFDRIHAERRSRSEERNGQDDGP